jgi:predicted phosphodiesterase
LHNAVLQRALLIAGLLFCASRLFAPTTFAFTSGDLVVRVTPAIPGGTVILDLGPFGELSWRTHRTPLLVRASFLLDQRARDLPALAELRDLRLAFLLRKLPWLAATGAFIGLLAVDGPRRRRLIGVAIGAGGVLVAGALLVGVTVLTFDTGAFDSPHYRGPIQDAPRVLQLLAEVRRDVAGAQANINKVAEGLERLHAQITRPAAPAPASTVRFLVVSDIHNNPIGLLIAKELAERFSTPVVLNGGDFTDRGTMPEAELFARFGSLAPRQVVVGGNHEDRATLDRIRTMKGVTVLERDGVDVVDVAGIRVLGDTDPNAYNISTDPHNAVAQAEIPVRCAELATRWEQTHADVVLVHDPRQGECAAAAAREAGAPLVFVWGHTHKPALEVRGSVLGISAGTSGANGVKTPRNAPYGFALLEFDPRTRSLVSACLFAFDDPAHLREASCHITSPAAAATP